MRQKAGRIIAAGLTQQVTFDPVDGSINDRIDDEPSAAASDGVRRHYGRQFRADDNRLRRRGMVLGAWHRVGRPVNR